MTKLFLNDNILSANDRGIVRYFGKIRDSLITEFGEQCIICSPEKRAYGTATYFPSVRFRGSHRIHLQDIISSSVAGFVKPNIFYNSYYGYAHTKAKQVFTVYDMIHEAILLPRHVNKNDKFKRMIQRFILQKKHCMERATLLLAISESTALDIVKFYPDLNPDKIKVIPLGVDKFFFEEAVSTQNKPLRPYFLYVGKRSYYKNFTRLLTAFGLSGLAVEFDLMVISPESCVFDNLETKILNEYNIGSSVHLMCAVSEEKVRESYANARAFIYPSEYEGFGLPILEAMASGTIVATSNLSSMPEVGGEVAFYFDPLNVESIVDCLLQLSTLSERDIQTRIKNGINRAKNYTWEQCQTQTVEALKNIL